MTSQHGTQNGSGYAATPLGSFALRQTVPGAGTHVTHHLLPHSVSPTMDLVLVFTTTPPSANAGGSAAQQAAGPNLSGLSAAQRLIQQRMAMMRARAAAAAGKAGPSSGAGGSADSGSGIVKGTAIEMTLYRIGSEADQVWKQSIKVPDVVFDDVKGKGKDKDVKQHETCRVSGMQYSPDGRTIALHIHLTRTDADSKQLTQAINLVALYSIDDGRLISLEPLSSATEQQHCSTHTNLSWITLSRPLVKRNAMLPAAHTAAANASSAANATSTMAASFVSSASSAGGGPGGMASARFQHLMGGAGSASSSTNKAASTLPSQRVLTADSPAKGGHCEGEDLMRGWACLSDEEDDARTCLLVPTKDANGTDGFALLLQGRVYFAFLPFSGGMDRRHVVSSRVVEGRVQALILEGEAQQCRVLATSQSPRYLSSPTVLSALQSILALSSTLSKAFTSALDVTYLTQTVYKMLQSPTQPPASSLSAHQLTSLPPLSRFLYTLSCVAQNFSQDVTIHLILSICDGSPTDMVETLLLSSLVEGKAVQMQSEIKTVYEVLECVASELARVLDCIGALLKELRGWVEWQERTRGFFPLHIGTLPIKDHLSEQFLTLKHLRSLAHHIISYSQGERLAWDEWAKWLVWERNRLESLKSADDDPMDAATFDPLVVVELVRRGFVSCELDWIVTGVKKHKQQEQENAVGDESEESFVKEDERISEKGQSGPTDVDGDGAADSARHPSTFELPAGLVADRSDGRSSLHAQLRETFSWLQKGETAKSTTADMADTHPPYHGLFEGGPTASTEDSLAGGRPNVYTMTPHALSPYMRKLTVGIKNIFTGMPGRLASQESGCVDWSREVLRFDVGEGLKDDDMGVVSLPVPAGSPANDGWHGMEKQARAAWSGDGDEAQLIFSPGVKNASEQVPLYTITLADHPVQQDATSLDGQMDLMSADQAVLLSCQSSRTDDEDVTPLIVTRPWPTSHTTNEGRRVGSHQVACSPGRDVVAVLSQSRASSDDVQKSTATAQRLHFWDALGA